MTERVHVTLNAGMGVPNPAFSHYVGRIPVYRAQFALYVRDRGSGWSFVDAFASQGGAENRAQLLLRVGHRSTYRIRYEDTGRHPSHLARMGRYLLEVKP